MVSKFADQPVAVLSREHLIKNKLAAAGHKTLADVEALQLKTEIKLNPSQKSCLSPFLNLMKHSIGLLVIFVTLAAGGKGLWPTADQTPRIGFLTSSLLFSRPHRGLPARSHQLGYVEGKNIVIEYRYAEGKSDRLPRLRPS